MSLYFAALVRLREASHGQFSFALSCRSLNEGGMHLTGNLLLHLRMEVRAWKASQDYSIWFLQSHHKHVLYSMWNVHLSVLLHLWPTNQTQDPSSMIIVEVWMLLKQRPALGNHHATIYLSCPKTSHSSRVHCSTFFWQGYTFCHSWAFFKGLRTFWWFQWIWALFGVLTNFTPMDPIKLLEKSTKLAHTKAHKFWGKQKSSRSGWENAICLSLLFLLTSKYCIICITFWDTIFAVPSPFRKDCLASSSRCLLGVSSDYGPNLHVVTARGPTGAWVTPE